MDGLAVSSLGAFGASWNETPTIDRMAAGGTTWDRVICTHDDTIRMLSGIWGQLSGDRSWLEGWKRRGRVELFLSSGDQATELAELAGQIGFDQCTIVETIANSLHRSDELDSPADEVEDAALSQLLLPLLERIGMSGRADAKSESSDWSMLWVHGDLLTRRWDAPRWLFPVEEEDDDTEPEDKGEWELEDFGIELSEADLPAAGMSAAEFDDEHTAGETFESLSSEALSSEGLGLNDDADPPALFDQVSVPAVKLTPDSHPDLVTSWMQTYGCQVRLLDRLIGLLLEALNAGEEKVGLALVGTSGFSLGQNGWIGHRVGPIRTPQIHVPVILFDGEGPGVRISGARTLEEAIASISSDSLEDVSARPSPEQWADDPERAVIVTQTARASRVITTDQWFFVQEGDEPHLFLKPDDRDDANDVADRCRDVVESMSAPVQPSVT
jgi:hypothetical protein